MIILRGHSGLSSWAERQRLESGQWRAIFPGIYWTAQRELSVAEWARAALLWGGPDAVLGGATAAHLHRLEGDWPAVLPVHLVLPYSRRCRAPQLLLSVAELESEDVDEVGGFRCTSAARTLVELARLGDEERLAFAFESAWRRDGFLQAKLEPALARGVPGGALLAKLVRDSYRRSRPLRSPLEVQVWRFLVANRLPLPEPDRLLWDEQGVLYADFAYLSRRFVLEVNGFAHHGAKEVQFEDDSRRTQRLGALGLSVYTITRHQVTRAPRTLLARLKAIFAAHPPGRGAPRFVDERFFVA